MTLPIAEMLTLLETLKHRVARDPTLSLSAIDDLVTALYKRLSTDLDTLHRQEAPL